MAPLGSLSHPTQLLLDCLQFGDPTARFDRLKGYSSSDWETVLEQANARGVAPLLAGLLMPQAQALGLPDIFRQTLQAIRLQSASRSLRLYHFLGETLALLDQAGIAVIVLKGAYLAETIYPDISMRPMGDVDLLVQRKDLAAAYDLIEHQGYRPEKKFTLENEVRHHHHLPMLLHASRPSIELHWTIALPGLPLQVDVEGLWQRAQPARIENVPVHGLAPEDLLLHLCMHLFQDRLAAGLKRLYDIGQLVTLRQRDIDWQTVIQRAEQWRCRRSLFLALHLAEELLGVETSSQVPASRLLDLPAGSVAQIEALARRRVVGEETTEVHPDLAHLWGKKPVRAKMAAFIKLVFPYPEYVARKYDLEENSWKVYPYYLVRLKDLLKQFTGQAWRLLFRKTDAIEQAQEENLLNEWWLAD